MDLLSRKSVTDALEKKTSVHGANEPHVQQLRVLADASDEEIHEALNGLMRKSQRILTFKVNQFRR